MTESRIARNAGARKSSAPPPQIAAVIKSVRKHLQGDAQDFRDITIDLDGTDSFALQVYQAARRIPAGQTTTYGELAKAVNRPAAARAVGQALGRNPIGLIIPCHRIVAAGGKPGGFSAHGGRSTKARMLAIEGVTFEPPPTIKSERDLRRAAALLRARDPRLALCMARPIAFTLTPEQSPYATLFEAVVHQQLSPKAATTILGRVTAIYPGSTIPEPGDLLKTPDRLLRGAGLSRAKTASLKDLAAKTLDGTVPSPEKIVALTDHEITRRLTAIYGVGRWTVEMLLIFNLGRIDVFPVDDYALRKSVADLYGMKDIPTPKQLDALGESWRPLRTVATLYLWNSIKPKGTEKQ
jgi:methylated-DNA-[protein]-cysteine S-methyltransferase